MDHMQFLLVRAHDGDQEEQFSGHVLMASCPPETHIVEHPDVPYPYDKLQEDPHRPELGKLLQLSQRLNLEGEITPIMAWGMIIGHPRFAELTQKDFKIIKDELKAKVRCYGFGAVLEEFEVRDALSSALATKIESYQVFA
ncbi:MAG: hypothetical protein M1833_004313 [Piccolia ochrophora]|nr:MAG: hypothetical protein M1833_004313 [Piccolia ochrophora]